MSDLNRKQLQPLYDYCRSVLPQFALAIRDADDEIERLTRQCTYKDEVIEQRNAMCLRAEARVEALEGALKRIVSMDNMLNEAQMAIVADEALAATEQGESDE